MIISYYYKIQIRLRLARASLENQRNVDFNRKFSQQLKGFSFLTELHFPRLNPELSAGCIGGKYIVEPQIAGLSSRLNVKYRLKTGRSVHWPIRGESCFPADQWEVLWSSHPQVLAGGEWEINKLYQIEIFFTHEPRHNQLVVETKEIFSIFQDKKPI